MNAALPIIGFFLLLALAIGIYAKRGRKMSLEQWTVGGRGFGSLMVFFLMAGEVFTTFTFLGASGWSYSKGAPTFYILAYGCLAFVTSYWILPPVWRFAKKHNLVSFPDFFATKYQSKALGIVIAIIAAIGMTSLLIIQLRGLGVIVSQTSYGAITPSIAIFIAAIGMVVYTIISGVRGSAIIAIFKDMMILIMAIFLGLYLPYHYYGGVTEMFTMINQAKPEFLRLPDEGLSLTWYNTTILVIGLGYYLYPHAFTAIYTAESERAIRKNAILMPLYQIVLAFMFLVGFAAIFKIPQLTGAEGDLALFYLIKQTFSPWFVGLIGGIGLLTALVPGAMILLNISTLVSRNIYQEGLAPQTTDANVAKIAKFILPLFALIAVYFTLGGGATFVSLSIFASSLLTQLLPTFAFAILPRPFGNKYAAIASIIVGGAVIAYFSLSTLPFSQQVPNAPSFIRFMNTGMIALLLNAATFVLVSLLTRKSSTGIIKE